MMAKLDREHRRTALLLIALVVVAFAFQCWQNRARSRGGRMWFDSAICAVSYPVQSLFLGVARGAERAWRMLFHARELERENIRLAARASQLEAALARRRESDSAARRQHELRSAYPEAPADAVLARVIGVASSGWSSYLTLDRGDAHGIAVGDVAVARAGAVGQVYAVARSSARVIPLTDHASGMAARIQRTRDTGIVKGLGNWRCELRYLEPDAEILPGDQVLTSGTGGVFPAGLRIGTVVSVAADPRGSGQVASVEAAAELRKIEEVLILPGRRSGREEQ